MKKVSDITVNIVIHSANNSLLASDPTLKKIIKQIQEDFPLTFIGLQKIALLSDQLDELFWLIDTRGIILIINNRFAQILGQDKSNIEGKKYTDFIPSSQVKLFSLINNYATDIKNCYSIRWSESKLFHLPSEKVFCGYPIFKPKNNLVAIAQFSMSESKFNFF